MKLWSVLLLIVSYNHLLTHAMHGGDTDYIEKVPYMAQVFRKYEYGLESFCGAAILAGRWLVTATHCMTPVDNLKSMQMRVGTNDTLVGGQIYNISRIINVAEYSSNVTRWNADLSLIELTTFLKFDDDRQPISITRIEPQAGDVITITGYGDDYGDVYGKCLKVGHQTVISKDECRKAYSKTDRKHIEIGDRVFCTNSTSLDLCGGDSGSPAVINEKIVGIAVEGCESPLPNIYINMAYFFSWVYTNMGMGYLVH